MNIPKRILSIGLGIILVGSLLVGCNRSEEDSAMEEPSIEKDISKEDQSIEDEVTEDKAKEVEEDSLEEEDIKNEIIPAGEEVVFKDENENPMMSLKINSVSVADKFIKKKDKNFSADPDQGVFDSEYEQAVELSYTYKNIGSDEKIEVTSFNLDVADIEGEISESVGVLKKSSKEVSRDMSYTAEAHYALVHKSDKVKVIFSSPMIGEDVIFEIPVSAEP